MNYVADRLLGKISSEVSKTSASAYMTRLKGLVRSPGGGQQAQRMVKRLDETGTFRPSDFGDLAPIDGGELARLPTGGQVNRYAHLVRGQRPGDARLVTRSEYVPGSEANPLRENIRRRAAGGVSSEDFIGAGDRMRYRHPPLPNFGRGAGRRAQGT